MTVLGAIFPPDLPPERLRPVVMAAEDAGLEQLWVWEDCFYESGISAAAAALAWTDRLVVGIGLLPVPLRNVGLTAMEIATLERLFPGRLVPGIGHGVLDWMGQVGARAGSPMTLLREYAVALRRLLRGERVTTSGRYVQLDQVALDWPPSPAPRLLLGAVGRKTLELAGEVGDGVILTGETTPETLREAMAAVAAGRGGNAHGRFDVVVFVAVDGALDADQVAARAGEFAGAGATHVIFLLVGDEHPPLEEFVRFVAHDVRPLVARSE